MLNSIGLENPGIEAVARDFAPVWAGWKAPVIVNIAGDSADDYARLAEKLQATPGVAAIEVNISCPNVAKGGLEFGADCAMATGVVRAVRSSTTLPVLVKLTPNVTDIADLARAVVSAGADALTVCNTLRGMAIDTARRRPRLGNLCGGLSGPAIKPVALYLTYTVARAVDVPVIGCGGIADGNDAVEFLMAGATAVQVGTATFGDPQAPLRVLEGIEGFLRSQGEESISGLIGQAQADRRR